MSLTTTRTKLADALTSLEGVQVQTSHRKDIGRLVTDYHRTFVDANPDDKEGFYELVDHTDPIEDALHAYEVRQTIPNSREVEVMVELLHQNYSPSEAMEELPQPTLDERDSPLDDPNLRDALNKSLAGIIPDFQEPVEDETKVYCEKCDATYEYTISVLSVHNMRRHEYHPDTYDYSNQECKYCGETTSFKGVSTKTRTELKACTECEVVQ